MPLPQIAVEIVVPDASPHGNSARKNPVESSELRRALLQACSDTVQVAVCVNADSARGAAALALVFWRGTSRVRIEVGSKDSPGGQTWTSREIDFSPRDAQVERWRAAGYAAGTLASLLIRSNRQRTGSEAPAPPGDEEEAGKAGAPQAAGRGGVPQTVNKGSAPQSGARAAQAPSEETSAQPGQAKEPKPAPELEPVSRPPSHEEAPAKEARRTHERVWRWSFDAGAAVGPGLSSSVPRAGAFVRVSRAFGGPFITVSIGYAEEKADRDGFSTHWIAPTLGVGYVAALGGSLTLEARGEFIAERIEVFADGAATLPYGTAYRWLLGGRGGAGFAWAFADPVAVVLGGTVSVRGPATDVFIGNDVRATIPVVAYGAEAGLRFTVR